MKKWFEYLTPGSLHDWNELEDVFLRKWGSKLNHVQALTEYNNLKKANHESVQDFSKIFNKVYNSIPTHIKPPQELLNYTMLKPLIMSFASY